MTINDLRQEHKAETGNYPFGADYFTGIIGSIKEADSEKLRKYIDWLENKVIELKNENYGSTRPTNGISK